MGSLLVTIEKQYGGETWSNTHCLRMGGADGPVVDADMTALGMATPITSANTASGATVNPLTRLIGFERLCHRAAIAITRVYVTDGKRNSIETADYFWSATLALNGLVADVTSAEMLVPGNTTLVINRTPLGFNSRGGRLFIRGVLADADIRFNLRGGVDWVNATQAAAYASIVSTAVNGSALNTMLNGGTNVAVALYCIPHYMSEAAAVTKTQIGQLISTTPCVSLSAGSPRGRQMLRGKKRKARRVFPTA